MKILFVINNMTIGGTRSSLLNFITYLSQTHKELDISLLVFSKSGEYFSRIPENIKVLEGDKWLECSFKSGDSLSWNEKINRSVIRIAKCILGQEKVLKTIFKAYIKNMQTEYDVVVGFQEGLCNDFAALVPAKKIVLWIHNNFENLPELSKGFLDSYRRADAIVFVAEASKRSFENQFPQYKDKMHLIRNVVLKSEIENRALEKAKDGFQNSQDKKVIKLVSVGRVAPQKAFDRAILAAVKMKKKGLKFEWIVIGDGPDFQKLKEETIKKEINHLIRFIGRRENPYSYMAQADLLVLSSIYEAQPMVIIEALSLGIPVLSTNFASANELLGGKKYGIIVENSAEGVVEGVCSLCSDHGAVLDMKNETRNFVYDNEKIAQEFLNL